MPKAEVSAAGRIVNFFNTADLPVADMVLQLCRDAVLTRKRVASSAALAPTAKPAAKPAAAPKKRSHKKKKTAPTPAPVEEQTTDLSAPAEAADAPPPA